MAEIVNLRQVRKRKKRREKEAKAATNRARFGRGKAARRRDVTEQTRRERDLEGKKLD